MTAPAEPTCCASKAGRGASTATWIRLLLGLFVAGAHAGDWVADFEDLGEQAVLLERFAMLHGTETPAGDVASTSAPDA